jgi:ATP-dependent Clp protease protease subunit
MEAVLKIYGDIGESIPDSIFMEGADMCSASMVSEFLDAHKEATELTVRINSRGGDVQEGWAIHDLLTNSGKKIKTIGEGKIYSIATIVFLAGAQREIMKNADGLIHNPFIPPYTLADQYESDDLLKIAESLKQEEAKILDFYVQRTGTPADKLAEYMKEDTKLSAEDMLSLGFATKIIEPILAYAYIKPKNKFTMKEDDVKTFGQKLDTIIDKIKNLSRVTPSDQTLKDKDGKEFKLEKESGSPAVGDKASPDGTFVMADGKTVVIEAGAVKEVREPSAAKSELEIANEKIAKLETEITDLKKVQTDASAEKAELLAETTKAQALVKELSALKNSWTPEGRTRFSSVDKVGAIDLTRVRELKEKINTKKE